MRVAEIQAGQGRTPRLTRKLILGTRMSPFGETIGTSSKMISSDSITVPFPCRTALLTSDQRRYRLAVKEDVLFAFSSTLALETSFFLKSPFLTSSIVVRSSSTRCVYPASSEISLNE